MEKLTVTIITKDEESNIGRCLESVKWADEIVVIDSGSRDKTLEICRRYGCRIIETEWLGFGPTKQLGVKAASNDWILSIDADEELTVSLIKKIMEVLASKDIHKGYCIKRNSFYLGRMIKFCWGRDFPLRLFNRNYGNFDEKSVHESVQMEIEVGKIKEPMLHYTYPTIESHVKKINLYSSLGAVQSYEKGKRSSIPKALLRGVYFFIEMYFFRLGFLDGKEGLVLSVVSSYGATYKYLKLWEIDKDTLQRAR
jgi:glycosyltransferase involved in cell wall biosynthesis